MTNAKFNLVIYKLSSLAITLCVIWFVSTLDLKFSILLAGLIFINNLSKFLFILEQTKEEDELISKIMKIVEKENDKNV